MQERANEIWLLLDAEEDTNLGVQIVWLALGLRDLGINARILVLGRRWLEQARLAVAVANARGIPTGHLPGGLIGLVGRLMRSRPSLLHTHGLKAGLIGRLAGRLTGIPVVSTRAPGASMGLQERLYATLDRLSRGWSAVSLGALDTDAGTRADVPLDPFVPLGERPETLSKTVAYVARPEPDSSVELYLRLADLVPPMDFQLYLHSRAIAPSWQALGPVRLRRIAADNSVPWSEIGLLCVFCSSDAALGRALEAMAHGVPVVAFANGLLPEVVRDGVNGWLVRPGNVAAAARLVNRWEGMDDSERRALSDAARRTIAGGFSTQTALPRLLTAYGLDGR